MDTPQYEPLYLEGIRLFNEQEFFEAHDTWEEHWTEYRGDSRKFYQGLIQTAVALYHFGRRNVHGSRKLYHSSRAYLQPYRPTHLGLDLDGFLAQFDACFAELIESKEEIPDVKLDPALIPKIEHPSAL